MTDDVVKDENCERKAQWRVTVDDVLLTQNFFGLGENSTGGALWDSSLVLWAKLRTMAIASRTVLELGSGVGFLAIKMASQGAHVVATDGDIEAISIFRDNVQRNGLPPIPAHHLSWGDAASLAAFHETYPSTSWDYLVGADLIFNADYHDALLATLVAVVVRPETRVLLAYRVRDEDKEAMFLEKVQGPFVLVESEEVGETGIVYVELQKRCLVTKLKTETNSSMRSRTAVAPSVAQALMPETAHRRAFALLGVLYVLVSLSVGLWYLSLLAPSLANDFWWAGYAPTRHEAFLVDVINAQLMLTRANALDVYAADATVHKRYASPTATTNVPPTYARRILLSELQSIEYAVPQLRLLSARWSMRMCVQHCWVDFNRTFQVAHTEARQRRCEDKYGTNAAVYMEATLRNVVWTDYVTVWGGENGPFTVALELALQETSRGQSFLSSVATARATTSVADELAYWRRHAMRSFELQWQNRYRPGVSETMVLQNALGMPQLLTLKDIPQGAGPWTSVILFWLPLNDLWQNQVLNRSLIRGSSRYFLANISADLPALDIEVMHGDTTVPGQFVAQAAQFRALIGPFQSIDCLHVAVPHSLLTAVAALRVASANDVAALVPPTTPIQLLPLTWHGHSYYGGSPLCVMLPNTSYVQQSFDFTNDCSSPQPLEVVLDPLALLVARVASATAFSIETACAAAAPLSVPTCRAALQSVDALYVKHVATADWPAAQHDIGLGVGLMQYATTATGAWRVLRQPLLEPSFAFFGWMFVTDWALGRREVLSFQGDVDSVPLISNVEAPLVYTTGTQELQTATQILFYLVVVTSIVLTSVGGVALAYACYARRGFHGANLFVFNRVTSAVWLGRPLTFLRAASATLLLSSVHTSLETSAAGTSRLVATPRHCIVAAVVAGEATWLTYVLNDLLVLLTQQRTRESSFFASTLAWGVLFLLDLISPIQVTGVLDRHCVGTNMDYSVSCTSGVLYMGSSTRVAVIATIQVGSVLLSWTALTLCSPHRPILPGPLLLNGLADAVLTLAPGSSSEQCAMDHVACVLAGVLPFRLRGLKYLFDIKLWVLVRDTLSTSPQVVVLPRPTLRQRTPVDGPAPTLIELVDKPSVRWRVVRRIVGLSYVVSSIVSSISYLSISQVNLSNDLFWASFNSTGAHAFFANWLNEQLMLGTTAVPALELTAPRVTLPTSFAAASTVVTSPANYGAHLQHTLLDSIEASIGGLRRSNGCSAPWIFSPYCYLDLEARWEMANSAARQWRCRTMRSNGAVYLESVLRNTNLASLNACWGQRLETAILADLRRSSAGQTWIDTTFDASLSVEDEAAYWRAQGLTHFRTQWQNYKRIGVQSSYSIGNAYGVTYPLKLASQETTYRLGMQTSFKMYWALANDLDAIDRNTSGIGGSSLLRHSANYAFANTSLAAVYALNGSLPLPLPRSLSLTASQLGPFGSIDMLYVAPPRALQRLVATITDRTRTLLATDRAAKAAYDAITPLDASYPVPSAWITASFAAYGSSPLCPELSSGQLISVGLVNLLSYDATCMAHSGIVSKVQPTRQQYIVSALLAQLAMSDNYTAVCRHEPSYLAACLVYLNATTSFVHTNLNPSDLAPNVLQVRDLVRAMNVSFMLFTAASTAGAPLQLVTVNLLDVDEAGFAFFAYLFLYDWVVGIRQVVTFQGDSGALTLITDVQAPLSQPPQASEIPRNIAQYFRSGVLYVTCVMMAIAGLATLYMLASHGQFEGWNMAELGRVGGIVWVGRPLLLLRAMTALCVLATATIELTYAGSMSGFATTYDPWYKTLLAANEVTWLITIVNDVLLVATGDYAAYYVTLNSFLVYAVVAVITLVSPVTPAASIDLHCELYQMDALVVCDAGTIYIGRIERLVLLLATVVVSHGVCYVIVRRHATPRTQVPSLFLSSGAKYQFTQTEWVLHDTYHLDRASAALDGLLTLRVHAHMILLDIKTWRTFVLPTKSAADTSIALAAAVPLLE
ncbi:hypothetical protein SDRG_10591 [Saprolegnia diclina VS20]|uniref:Uncharacterized protein n=1 Tax=Saprolegnia diclina (strain VS20) TaxID=1156394 RepID=T0RNZ6_SAPDV|nr:hypothetical protein SDRG_10591 [Saprolegnia diclina VS20]EQC31802.1 hypothetical protein SDRG_10591 [Saprolegnia diclina VS20]|eukprot:XP_008614809.1 hypothetical protein SDRG_10591 [Saprolegnia diclina VS20]